MNAQRLILLVVSCTCYLAGWGAELEDFEGCSTLVDASEKLDCFERITRILVDQRAAGANNPAKVQGESGKVQVIVESMGEAVEDKEAAKEGIGAAEDTAVKAASEELGEVTGNEAIAPEVIGEVVGEAQGEASKDKLRIATREAGIPSPVGNSDSDAAKVLSDFSTRENGLNTTNISSVVVDVNKSKVKKNIYVVTLANRQVWRETQFGKGTSYRSGDGVTIKASRMGSFVLTNRRTGFSCHVRRIN